MKRLAVFLIVTLFAVVGGGAYYMRCLISIQPVSQSVLDAENALAMSDVIFFAHAHVAQAVALEDAFLGGAPDKDVLPDPRELEESKLLPALQKRGVDLRGDTEHWVAAGYVAEQSADFVNLFIGEFPLDEIRAALQEIYTVTPGTGETAQLLILEHTNVESCKTSAPIGVFLGKEEIIAGPPVRVAQIVSRLQAGALPESDLSRWRGYRETHMASAAVLVPRLGKQLIKDPILRMLAEAAA